MVPQVLTSNQGGFIPNGGQVKSGEDILSGDAFQHLLDVVAVLAGGVAPLEGTTAPTRDGIDPGALRSIASSDAPHRNREAGGALPAILASLSAMLPSMNGGQGPSAAEPAMLVAGTTERPFPGRQGGEDAVEEATYGQLVALLSTLFYAIRQEMPGGSAAALPAVPVAVSMEGAFTGTATVQPVAPGLVSVINSPTTQGGEMIAPQSGEAPVPSSPGGEPLVEMLPHGASPAPEGSEATATVPGVAMPGAQSSHPAGEPLPGNPVPEGRLTPLAGGTSNPVGATIPAVSGEYGVPAGRTVDGGVEIDGLASLTFVPTEAAARVAEILSSSPGSTDSDTEYLPIAGFPSAGIAIGRGGAGAATLTILVGTPLERFALTGHLPAFKSALLGAGVPAEVVESLEMQLVPGLNGARPATSDGGAPLPPMSTETSGAEDCIPAAGHLAAMTPVSESGAPQPVGTFPLARPGGIVPAWPGTGSDSETPVSPLVISTPVTPAITVARQGAVTVPAATAVTPTPEMTLPEVLATVPGGEVESVRLPLGGGVAGEVVVQRDARTGQMQVQVIASTPEAAAAAQTEIAAWQAGLYGSVAVEVSLESNGTRQTWSAPGGLPSHRDHGNEGSVRPEGIEFSMDPAILSDGAVTRDTLLAFPLSNGEGASGSWLGGTTAPAEGGVPGNVATITPLAGTPLLEQPVLDAVDAVFHGEVESVRLPLGGGVAGEVVVQRDIGTGQMQVQVIASTPEVQAVVERGVATWQASVNGGTATSVSAGGPSAPRAGNVERADGVAMAEPGAGGEVVGGIVDWPSVPATPPHVPAGSPSGPSSLPDIPALQQLYDRITWLSRSGESEARFQLNPEELGAVGIRLQMKEGQVTIHLVAESADTGALLQEHLPALKSALATQGLQIDSLNISVGNGATSWQGQSPSQGGHSFSDNAPHYQDSRQGTFPSGVAAPRQEGQRQRASARGIDYRV